jgi:AAA domain
VANIAPDDIGACNCGRPLGQDQDGLYCQGCEKDCLECTCEPQLTRIDQLRRALLDSAALDSLPEPVPLIRGILQCDTLAWLHGKPGCGKSFVALDWAGCVSTGLPWQMHETTQGPVLYVIAEGVSGLRGRVRAWENYTQTKTMVQFLPIAVQLMHPGEIAAVIQLAADLQPILIVIDTQARVTVGADENSAKDMGELVAAIGRIRYASRACVLVVHHEARAGENMRGSTALEGAADTLVKVTKDGPHLTLANPKQKDSVEFEPIRLRLVPRLESATIQSHDGVGLAEELSASEGAIIDLLRDTFGTSGASGSTLFDVAALPKSTYYRALNRLVSGGFVVNDGSAKRSHYLLPEFRPAPQSQLVPDSPVEPVETLVPSPTPL